MSPKTESTDLSMTSLKWIYLLLFPYLLCVLTLLVFGVLSLIVLGVSLDCSLISSYDTDETPRSTRVYLNMSEIRRTRRGRHVVTLRSISRPPSPVDLRRSELINGLFILLSRHRILCTNITNLLSLTLLKGSTKEI